MREWLHSPDTCIMRTWAPLYVWCVWLTSIVVVSWPIKSNQTITSHHKLSAHWGWKMNTMRFLIIQAADWGDEESRDDNRQATYSRRDDVDVCIAWPCDEHGHMRGVCNCNLYHHYRTQPRTRERAGCGLQTSTALCQFQSRKTKVCELIGCVWRRDRYLMGDHYLHWSVYALESILNKFE